MDSDIEVIEVDTSSNHKKEVDTSSNHKKQVDTSSNHKKQVDTSSNHKKIPLKEVTESLQIQLKSTPKKSEPQPNTQQTGGESPLHVPRHKRKRIISDDDDDFKKLKTQEDQVSNTAFEDMCEAAVAELQSLFPEVDVCELQDVLLACNWSVFDASLKLGNIHKDNGYDDVETKSNTSSTSTSHNGTHHDNHKMKDMKEYKKTSTSSTLPSTSSLISIKNAKKHFVSSNKKKNDDEEVVISDDDEESGDEYEKEDIVGKSSDDDDDDSEDEDSKKPKKSAKQNMRIENLREKVVSFLNSATVCDLQSVSGLSAKKIDVIMSMRPFTDWPDALSKFKNHSLISTDILNNCCEAIRAREMVERLMDSCEQIAEQLSDRVENLSPLEQPSLLNPKMSLSKYQLIGLNWLVLMDKHKLNAILADEMGLGKTIQVIAFIAYLREMRNNNGPHLIIVPSSTIDNWSREIQTWCPAIELLLYYGSLEERAELRRSIFADDVYYDVILTTYNMVYGPEDKILFRRTCFNYVVFDEAHMLKNMRSNRYAGLIKIRAKRRLLLTGTPLQNNLLELMSLLIFTMPHMFEGKIDHVKSLFTHSNHSNSSDRITFINERIQQAKKIMKPFVLRRLKNDVLKELPPKIEHKCVCPMAPEQELKYMELIENYTREIKYKKISYEGEEFDEKYGTFLSGASMLMKLRKAANHPLLLRTFYDDSKLKKMSQMLLKEPSFRDNDSKYIYEDMEVMHDFELHALCQKYKSLSSFKLSDENILGSGKFQQMDSLLSKFKREGKRVLLFSQFTIMLDIIEEYMKLRSYKFLRLDGSTKVSERIELIDKFTEDPSIFVFLLSTRAGGLGINLTAATVVIIHDIDFNPYNDKQAEDRCHRIGQTKEVIVYRLISQNTVEEGMFGIAEEKLKLGRDISSSSKNEKDEKMDKSDVKTLLRATLRI